MFQMGSQLTPEWALVAVTATLAIVTVALPIITWFALHHQIEALVKVTSALGQVSEESLRGF
jgi:hypothetical protein